MSIYQEELNKARRLDATQVACLLTILVSFGSLYVTPEAVDSGIYASRMVIVIIMALLVYAIRRKKRNDILDAYMEKLLEDIETLKKERQ